MPKRSGGRRRDKEARSGFQNQVKQSETRAQGGSTRRGYFKHDAEIPLASLNYTRGGDYLLDIVDVIARDTHPTAEKGKVAYRVGFSIHKDVGPRALEYICPEAWSLTWAPHERMRCPVCEHRRKLIKEGAAKAVWKALYPRNRSLYNVIIRSDLKQEQLGIQVLDVSDHYFEDNLLAIAKIPTRPGSELPEAYVYFSDPDPEEGKTISFKISPPKSSDDYASFGGFKFVDRDYVITDEELAAAFYLEDFLEIPSYTELYESYWDTPLGGSGGIPNENVPFGATQDDSENNPDDLIEGTSKEGCPFEYNFGMDNGQHDECDKCSQDIWDNCNIAFEEMKKLEEEMHPKEPEPEPEPAPRVPRRPRRG